MSKSEPARADWTLTPRDGLPRLGEFMKLSNFALVAAGLLIGGLGTADPVLVNGLAVAVNDTIITRQDVVEATLSGEQVLVSTYRSQPQRLQQELDDLRRDQLDHLVDRQLILHEFKTAGYKLPESVIDEQIKATMRRHFENRSRMIKSLRAEGVTWDSYRQRVREDIIVNAMIQKNIASEIIISPHKIETYYQEHPEEFKVEDRVKLRMIFLKNKPDRDAATTRKFADEIATKLAGGAQFPEMASLYSDGSQSSKDGDWFEKSVLRQDLADVAFSLKSGERSGVIEKSDGCYLMLVEDSQPARVKPLPDVRDEIEKNLQLKEKERLRKQWIERLKTKSFIQYFPAS
jgi:peptidyl-prolyl cis-trans isomerase SurA